MTWCSLYWHELVYEFLREGKEYPNTSCDDALVPPYLPVLRCDHDEEAHVKQSRHPTSVTCAYYCCHYKSMSNIWHLWFLEFDFQKMCNVTLTSFSSCKNRICADSSGGLRALRCETHKFFCSRMIEVSLFCIIVSSVGFPRRQIHLQWQMRRSRK
jgi:hypothetical protein